MHFGPRKNTEREVEEVLEVAERFKAEDEVEKRRLTEKFDLQVLIEREKHTVSLLFDPTIVFQSNKSSKQDNSSQPIRRQNRFLGPTKIFGSNIKMENWTKNIENTFFTPIGRRFISFVK